MKTAKDFLGEEILNQTKQLLAANESPHFKQSSDEESLYSNQRTITVQMTEKITMVVIITEKKA